jgi:hypothetical protein
LLERRGGAVKGRLQRGVARNRIAPIGNESVQKVLGRNFVGLLRVYTTKNMCA